MMFGFLHPDWQAQWHLYLGAIAFGYLLGSIPFGLIFTYFAGAGDVRKIGSGNIGATNVLRTGNRGAAGLTLLFDAGKGATAVLLARAYLGDEFAVVAGLGAFLGHIFPVWLGFKGGKGIATSLGILLSVYWPAGVICALIWIGVVALTRISSLGALIAALFSPVVMMVFEKPLYATLTALLTLIIFYSHRENIVRLLRGTEPRIGIKKTEPPPNSTPLDPAR